MLVGDTLYIPAGSVSIPRPEWFQTISTRKLTLLASIEH